MRFSLLAVAHLAPLAAAHFVLNYPPSREADESNMGVFPCGGGTPSTERTQVSLSSPSFPIALNLGHDESAVEFLLALGTDPGTNFNITLKHTFRAEGMGAFCIPEVALDESVLGVNLTDGLNMTLQVQTNSHPSGGLYACADLQLTTGEVEQPSPSVCSNNTGVSAIDFTGAAAHRNANESTPDGQAQSGSSDSTSETSSQTGSQTATSPTSTGAATALQTAAWGILGAAVAGGLAVL